jgi:hypothetical protein
VWEGVRERAGRRGEDCEHTVAVVSQRESVVEGALEGDASGWV